MTPLDPSLRASLSNLFAADTHGRLFLVGGTVRDHLLGRPIRDLDLVAALSPEELQRAGFRRVEPKSSAPIWFRGHDTFGKIEVTALQSPSELEPDLLRRDFTVNAMACSFDGRLIDPLGGCSDLEEKSLRPCSALTFRSDPIRIFRAFRFEADGWRMTAEAEGLIRECEWRESLHGIPIERFSGEMLRSFAGRKPGRFFQRMIEFTVGSGFLPELFLMRAVPAGPPEHHPEGDLLTHSLQVLDRVCECTENVAARFCALFHDLGKLSTPPELYPKHHGHDEAGWFASRDFCNRMKLPETLRVSLGWVNRLHTTANRWEELRNGTRITLAEQAARGDVEGILPFIVEGDKPGGKGMTGWDEAVRIVRLPTADLGIDQRLFAAHPVDGIMPLHPDQRSVLIHQKRVELFRNAGRKNASEEKLDLTPGTGSDI